MLSVLGVIEEMDWDKDGDKDGWWNGYSILVNNSRA